MLHFTVKRLIFALVIIAIMFCLTIVPCLFAKKDINGKKVDNDAIMIMFGASISLLLAMLFMP